MAAERPMVNVYEAPGPETELELVYRPMNDAELEAYLAACAAWEAQQERPVSPIIAAVEAMTDDELNQLRELLA